MNLFISASGVSSNIHGSALYTWLPEVLPGLRLFFDSRIGHAYPGSREQRQAAIESAEFAVFCVSPTACRCPNLLYEAGALAHQLGEDNVFLLRFEVKQCPGPLDRLPSEEFSEEGVLRFLRVVNSRLGERSLQEGELVESFETSWDRLHDDIADRLAARMMVPPSSTFHELPRHNGLVLTEVHLRLVDKKKLKAYVAVVFNGCLTIRGYAVLERQSGSLFVADPTTESPSYRDICKMLNRDARYWLQDAILSEYEAARDAGETRWP